MGILFGIPTRNDTYDRRKEILEAGLAILQEQGLTSLTQPKIAARTGLRQSHLTYYYPTRADLLTAVARMAIETQLAAMHSLVKRASSIKKTAAVTSLHKNTRVLTALNQAADQEPSVRALFNELLNGFTGDLVSS